METGRNKTVSLLTTDTSFYIPKRSTKKVPKSFSKAEGHKVKSIAFLYIRKETGKSLFLKSSIYNIIKIHEIFR